MAPAFSLEGNAQESVIAELQAIAEQLRAAGLCEPAQAMLGTGLGFLVAKLGRDETAHLFDRWIAAQALVVVHME
jgi:hypothetical protein